MFLSQYFQIITSQINQIHSLTMRWMKTNQLNFIPVFYMTNKKKHSPGFFPNIFSSLIFQSSEALGCDRHWGTLSRLTLNLFIRRDCMCWNAGWRHNCTCNHWSVTKTKLYSLIKYGISCVCSKRIKLYRILMYDKWVLSTTVHVI